MSRRHARGATLVVGLILLSLVTLLGIAGAGSAHIEAQLAQGEQFRENAVSAASAGIEIAISSIVTSPSPASVSSWIDQSMPGTTDRLQVRVRFAGLELALPQAPGSRLVGAHFDIESTGFSARRAVDRQRAAVMLIVTSAEATPLACEPEVPGRRCRIAGTLERLSWQRVPVGP